jgi:uncharacterized protein (TIGR02246 family)
VRLAGIRARVLTADQIREVCERAVAAWNANDLDGFYAPFRANVLYHGGEGIELSGIDALREHYGKALAFVPDLKIDVELRVVDAEAGTAASLQTESGRALDGEVIAFRGMTFFRFEDAEIVEVWELTRPVAASRQT